MKSEYLNENKSDSMHTPEDEYKDLEDSAEPKTERNSLLGILKSKKAKTIAGVIVGSVITTCVGAGAYFLGRNSQSIDTKIPEPRITITYDNKGRKETEKRVGKMEEIVDGLVTDYDEGNKKIEESKPEPEVKPDYQPESEESKPEIEFEKIKLNVDYQPESEESEPEQEPESEEEYKTSKELFNDFMNYVDGRQEDGTETTEEHLKELSDEIMGSLGKSEYSNIDLTDVVERMKVRKLVEKWSLERKRNRNERSRRRGRR